MDRVGIDWACVFSTLAITIDMRAGNDLSLAAARAFPDRLLAYAVPDPNRAAEVLDELRRCFDAGARGIKFHTQLHAYPFDGPGYRPTFAFAHEHRLPLISHGAGSPDTLRRVARAHPDAHFIVAHAGAGRAGPGRDGLLDVAAEEPNVYLVKSGHEVALVQEVGSLARGVGVGKNGGDWEALPWPEHRYRF